MGENMKLKTACAAVAILLSTGLASPVVAQDFPSKPISVVIGFGAFIYSSTYYALDPSDAAAAVTMINRSS